MKIYNKLRANVKSLHINSMKRKVKEILIAFFFNVNEFKYTSLLNICMCDLTILVFIVINQ